MPSLRVMEILAPRDREEILQEVLDGEDRLVGVWRDRLEEEMIRVRVLLPRDRTEAVSDALSERLTGEERFRVMLFDVEATVPRVDEPEKESEGEGEGSGEGARGERLEEDAGEHPARVSREELYFDVQEGSELTGVYLVTVALSTLVASLGLVRSDLAVIIGAMVIAPLLGPNVALALAATLGDAVLARRSLQTIAAGVATALVVSVLLGVLLTIDPGSPELAARTDAGFSDLALALAAGTAGALAFTTGIPTALIGVMVAVALLPPLAATGLLLGSGDLEHAGGAGLLVLLNVACINLAGIATFLAQRVRPRTWWEEEQAKRATRLAIGAWLGLLALLAVAITLIWYR